MVIQTIYRGYEIRITPPVAVINSIPVLAYRLAPQEIEEIAEKAFNGSPEGLDKVYAKAVDAFKRIQGEFETLGGLKILKGKVAIRIGNKLYYLEGEGLFSDGKSSYRVFSILQLDKRER